MKSCIIGATIWGARPMSPGRSVSRSVRCGTSPLPGSGSGTSCPKPCTTVDCLRPAGCTVPASSWTARLLERSRSKGPCWEYLATWCDASESAGLLSIASTGCFAAPGPGSGESSLPSVFKLLGVLWWPAGVPPGVPKGSPGMPKPSPLGVPTRPPPGAPECSTSVEVWLQALACKSEVWPRSKCFWVSRLAGCEAAKVELRRMGIATDLRRTGAEKELRLARMMRSGSPMSLSTCKLFTGVPLLRSDETLASSSSSCKSSCEKLIERLKRNMLLWAKGSCFGKLALIRLCEVWSELSWPCSVPSSTVGMLLLLLSLLSCELTRKAWKRRTASKKRLLVASDAFWRLCSMETRAIETESSSSSPVTSWTTSARTHL
mmetsp:Transcript_93202/g.259626  ORF Transcript_93202/g.259626 Transcript_93202/m.259626 type:complete len:376 (-) Transcript_93202:2321-3448(-)